MAAPLGNHDAGVSLGGPAEEDAQQVRSLELEAAVETLRARVLELGGAEAIPEKAATEVAAELPGMLSDATLGQFSVTTVAHLAAAFVHEDAGELQKVFSDSLSGLEGD